MEWISMATSREDGNVPHASYSGDVKLIALRLASRLQANNRCSRLRKHLAQGRPNSFMHGSAFKLTPAQRHSRVSLRSVLACQTFQHLQGRCVQLCCSSVAGSGAYGGRVAPSLALSWTNRGADDHRADHAGVRAASHSRRRCCTAPAGRPSTLQTSWRLPRPGAVGYVDLARSAAWL